MTAQQQCEDLEDDDFPFPAAEQNLPRIDQLRAIVKDHAMRTIDGVGVDVQTANACVRVYDALNDANKAKLMALPVAKMGLVAWKMVSR